METDEDTPWPVIEDFFPPTTRDLSERERGRVWWRENREDLRNMRGWGPNVAISHIIKDAACSKPVTSAFIYGVKDEMARFGDHEYVGILPDQNGERKIVFMLLR